MTKEQATIEYHELICGALDTPRMEGDVHHIVPRSCGGLDCDTNLVRLTCQEHFKAHELLPFIYDKGREHKAMVSAWVLMSGRFNGKEITAEEYANLKREYASAVSRRRTGASASEETRRRMSESHKGKPSPNRGKPMSEETRQKCSGTWFGGQPPWNKGIPAWNKGRKDSEETRRRKSEAKKRYYERKRNHLTDPLAQAAS